MEQKIASGVSAGDVGSGPSGTTDFTLVTEAPQVDVEISSKDVSFDGPIETNVVSQIAQYLAKPIAVASGVWSTSDAYGALLYSNRIYPLIDAQPLWKNKIQGFLNMRGTVRLELVTNAMPFQAGLLRLSVMPIENVLTFEATAHTFNRDTISQLPGGYVSASDDKFVMRLPYMGPTRFLQRDLYATGGHVDWGKIYIHCFEKFRTGGLS